MRLGLVVPFLGSDHERILEGDLDEDCIALN